MRLPIVRSTTDLVPLAVAGALLFWLAAPADAQSRNGCAIARSQGKYPPGCPPPPPSQSARTPRGNPPAGASQSNAQAREAQANAARKHEEIVKFFNVYVGCIYPDHSKKVCDAIYSATATSSSRSDIAITLIQPWELYPDMGIRAPSSIDRILYQTTQHYKFQGGGICTVGEPTYGAALLDKQGRRTDLSGPELTAFRSSEWATEMHKEWFRRGCLKFSHIKMDGTGERIFLGEGTNMARANAEKGYTADWYLVPVPIGANYRVR